MNAIEFVTKLRERVIEDDNKIYQNLLNATKEAKDPVWQGILPIYKNLSEEQQIAFFLFLRMIQVSTMSHILGILDGTTVLTKNIEKFILKITDEEETMSGNLQDIFFEMEEDGSR